MRDADPKQFASAASSNPGTTPVINGSEDGKKKERTDDNDAGFHVKHGVAVGGICELFDGADIRSVVKGVVDGDTDGGKRWKVGTVEGKKCKRVDFGGAATSEEAVVEENKDFPRRRGMGCICGKTTGED